MYKYLFLFTIALMVKQDTPRITWDEDYKVQWQDFKGTPQHNTTTVAVTASGISFGFSSRKTETELVSFTTSVKADFYPERSWYIKERVNDTVLNHERLHFDITELYARKFRKRLQESTFTYNINDEMDKIHDAINKELGAMQKKYDNETDHSQIVEKQIEWEKYIALELEKYAKYK
jgi:hypothetical protein